MPGETNAPPPTALPVGLVNDRQLHAYLPVTSRTLFTLRGRGLPHIKMDGKVLYHVPDVLAWMRSTYGVSGQGRADLDQGN